jgi:ornithine decarboxylase
VTAAATRREARAARTLREIRRDEVSALLRSDVARAALALHGTPVLLLDPERVRRQYRRLATALPFVRFHYAVKALSHTAVLHALADEGCGFDVATGEELALLEGVSRERIIHTHPIKKPSEINEALDEGIRVFVVDNDAELDKFVGAPDDVRLLVRLAYRSPHAKSDLSTKFGVGPFEAAHLVERARERGIRIAGFSFHVGSQLDDPPRFAAAIRETFALMDHLEATHDVRFDILDIGGGFPVAYDEAVTSVEDLAAVIRPVLEERADRLEILAEPGRILVGEAMTLVTSVVGIAERGDGRWYYLDDGLYGAYSNVLTEDVHPMIFPESELDRSDSGSATHRWATLAGPTCDSTDVIAREALLPDLAVGDLLASPAMGAYSVVTATRFNGRAVTPIAVVDHAARTGELRTVDSASAPASAPAPKPVPETTLEPAALV